MSVLSTMSPAERHGLFTLASNVFWLAAFWLLIVPRMHGWFWIGTFEPTPSWSFGLSLFFIVFVILMFLGSETGFKNADRDADERDSLAALRGFRASQRFMSLCSVALVPLVVLLPMATEAEKQLAVTYAAIALVTVGALNAVVREIATLRAYRSA